MGQRQQFMGATEHPSNSILWKQLLRIKDCLIHKTGDKIQAAITLNSCFSGSKFNSKLAYAFLTQAQPKPFGARLFGFMQWLPFPHDGNSFHGWQPAPASGPLTLPRFLGRGPSARFVVLMRNLMLICSFFAPTR